MLLWFPQHSQLSIHGIVGCPIHKHPVLMHYTCIKQNVLKHIKYTLKSIVMSPLYISSHSIGICSCT